MAPRLVNRLKRSTSCRTEIAITPQETCRLAERRPARVQSHRCDVAGSRQARKAEPTAYALARVGVASEGSALPVRGSRARVSPKYCVCR